MPWRSADGFSFYCCSPQFLPAIENESYRFDTDSNQAAVIEKALSTSNLLKRNYTTVQCIIAGPSIQIPLEYFRKEEATAFYQLSYAETEARKTYYNILPSLEIAEVFTVDKTVEEVLRQHFPQIRFFHIHTMLLEKMVPPTQWVKLRQNSSPWLMASTSVRMEAPVVVKPLTVSKNASA